MEIIQQIGSYAGLAAIVGLAVMSALYFSQARDLRRLRESRATEEAGSPAQPAKRPTAAGAGAGVAKGDAPAAPAAQSPQPATAVTVPTAAKPATASSQSPAPAKPAPGAPGQPTVPAKPAPGTPGQPTPVAKPAAAASSQRPATAVAPGTAAAQAGAGAGPPKAQGEGPGPATATPPPPGPSPGAPAGAAAAGAGGANDSAARPLPRRLADQSSAATARPVVAPAARRPPWYRRLAPRYIVLIVAAVLVVATGVAFGVSALTGAGEGARDQAANADRGDARDRPPLDPSTVTVAVLNGTSTIGAAQQTADIVQGAGFARGTVANDSEPSAESAVLFAEGEQQAAREVGKELDISQVEPIDATTEGLAGEADVVVVVGADRT